MTMKSKSIVSYDTADIIVADMEGLTRLFYCMDAEGPYWNISYSPTEPIHIDANTGFLYKTERNFNRTT